MSQSGRILTLLASCTLLLSATAHAAPQTPRAATKATGSLAVFSIVPAQAEPGTPVTLTLTSVRETMTLHLGGNLVPWRALDERRISFEIPVTTPPGQHSLSLQEPDGTVRSYAFTVVPLKPVAISIDPDRITSCVGDASREVTIKGRNFEASSQLLFDGAIIRSRFVPPDSIHFIVPPASSGLHKVSVKNHEFTTTPLGIAIITAPEVTSVTIGADHVNSYELVVDGDNFQQTSSLLVNGTRIDTNGNPTGERLIFVDCTKLIYQRLPYSSTPKELRIQVVNPAGEASQTVLVTAP